MKFMPSPTKRVVLLGKDGQPRKIVPMNRAQRRRLKIRSIKRNANTATRGQ